MILTEKCKGDFLEFIHINEDRFQNYNFYKLDESMQNALIIEWFDSIKYSKNTSLWEYCFEYEYSNSLKTFKHIVEQSIIKANEIYNERE